MERPTVSQAVHYVAHGTDTCSAALVTAVPRYIHREPFDGCPNGAAGTWEVNLVAFHPDGMGLNFPQGRMYDPTGAVGTWHLPGEADCSDS